MGALYIYRTVEIKNARSASGNPCLHLFLYNSYRVEVRTRFVFFTLDRTLFIWILGHRLFRPVTFWAWRRRLCRRRTSASSVRGILAPRETNGTRHDQDLRLKTEGWLHISRFGSDNMARFAAGRKGVFFIFQRSYRLRCVPGSLTPSPAPAMFYVQLLNKIQVYVFIIDTRLLLYKSAPVMRTRVVEKGFRGVPHPG